MKPFLTTLARVRACAAFTVLCVLCAGAFAPAALAQAETSASLGGAVTAADTRNPVAGASVSLRHAGTGDVLATRTNSAGRYVFIGLRPDETYSLRVSAANFDSADFPGVTLSLGEERQFDVALADPAKQVVQLEAIVVTTTREAPQPGGLSTTFTHSEIEERPGIDQTLNDFATADPRITMIDLEYGEIAAAGQNFRFNSIQIDGIRMDDQFGLEYDGLPTLGNPFAMETVQAISIDLTPYQVTRGGFTGAAINAVSKSGDNVFGGTAHYSYRNEKFRAPNPNSATDPKVARRIPFAREDYGIMLKGPLVKNHVFFMASWERTTRSYPPREDGFAPDAADVGRVITIANEKYGYDAGALVDPGGRNQKTDRFTVKLDWLVNAQHRLSVRYNGSHGADPVYRNYGAASATSLSSHWEMRKRHFDGWNAQLFSQWHSAFHTEISFTQQVAKARPLPFAPWPEVRINGVKAAGAAGDDDTGSLWIGTAYDSQENNLVTKNTQGRLVATWLLGKHRVEFGLEEVRSDFENTYLRYAWGRYTFASIDDFEAGTPSAVTFQYTNNGEVPVARWGCAIHSAFVQDTWRPFRSLTLTAGLRFDYPAMSDKPRYNPTFAETFGMRNDGTINGASTLAPRLSFGWTPSRQRQLHLRGGAGLFQGRAPGVWLSNSFTNDGLSALQSTNNKPSITFNPDIHYRPPLDPETLEMPVNLMRPKLRLPAIIRGNIAADMRLPWQGMTATIEWLWSRSYNSLVYRDINLRRTGAGPDGRPLYGTWTVAPNGSITHDTNSQLLYNTNNKTGYDGPSFDDVYLLTNADRGKDKSRASYLTFMLRRPVRDHWGLTLSYTRGHATEVSPVSTSTAQSNFSRRVSIDPNSDECGVSSTEVRDRILATLTFKFALLRKTDTTLQFIYDGHTGRPYSFSFTNDANGDGATSNNNDLFYVPSGRNDPKIYWATPADADRFFAYLATNDRLRRYAGQIVPRNSERCPFQHRVAVRLMQQIPLRGKFRAEFILNISNLPNLLDDAWGRYYQYGTPFAKPVAAGYYDPRTNQYRYSFAAAPREPTLQTSASRWEIQAGVKVKF